MVASARPNPSADLADLASTIGELVGRELVQNAEVVLACITLHLLGRLEQGSVSGDAATHVLVAVDCALTGPGEGSSLSPEAQELIFEGEHLHHFGDEYGPDTAYLRRLANTILERAERR